MKIVAKNRRANFEYELLERFTAGMQLRGWQVKSIKAGNASIKQAYCYVGKGEAFVRNMQISEWKGMGDLERQRAGADIKLLLHKAEIEKLEARLKQQGLTLIPTVLGLEKGFIKLEFALARGKKLWDKRATKKNREQKRNLQREVKGEKYF